MTKQLYDVTITPKYPTWNYKQWTVQVLATSRSDANKVARKQLENDGHVFTQSDAASFSAKLAGV